MHFLRNVSVLLVAVFTLASATPAADIVEEDLIYIKVPGFATGSADQTVGVPFTKSADGKSIIDIEELNARIRARHDEWITESQSKKGEVRISGSVQYHENGDLDTFTLHADLGPEHYNKEEL